MRTGLLTLASIFAFAAAPLPSQTAGELRFSGTGVVGTPMKLAFAGGSQGGKTAFLVLSPLVGTFTAGSMSTDCFAAAPGLIFEVISLGSTNRFDIALTLPLDRAFVGRYFAGQAFRDDSSTLLRSNCASFLIATDIARSAITETFDDDTSRPRAIGGGKWADPVAGALLPADIGGGGVLGRFDHELGKLVGGVYEFSTDSHSFPASVTLLGAPVTVTDGVFEFLDFVVPAGVTVRFTGKNPARIFVSGTARIEGTLDVGALDMDRPSGAATETKGQPGGMSGPGGGRGGSGGDAPAVVGGKADGQPGEDLVVSAKGPHAGKTTKTGGQGSAATPDSAAKVTYTFFNLFSNQMSAGGGGGGFTAAGAPGKVNAERAPKGSAGAPGAGGNFLNLLPPRATHTSREQFLTGGSGGGGAGLHVYDSVKTKAIEWAPGSGGAGGGGALLVAVGGDCTIATTGKVVADGGSAASRNDKHGLLRAPGGGGSGGTVLFQVGGRFKNNGVVTAVGGAGGVTEDLRATPGTKVAGGKGAPGFIRVESNSPLTVRDLGTMDPPASALVMGPLTDQDDVTLAASGWYPLPKGADPSLLGYEVYTVQAGSTVIYSDRRGLGSGPVRSGKTPVTIYTRFAQLDAAGAPVAGSITGWYEGAAIPKSGSDGAQVVVFFDRQIRGPKVDLRLETLRLTF